MPNFAPVTFLDRTPIGSAGTTVAEPAAADAACLAGLPALAQPVRTPDGPLPASLQLAGPKGSEETLLATGAVGRGGRRAPFLGIARPAPAQ